MADQIDDPIDDVLIELAGMCKLVSGLGGRLDDQERLVKEAFERLGAIEELLGQVDPAFMLSPWWWPSMTQSQAADAWKALTTWVDDIIIARYDNGSQTPDGKEWALGGLRHSEHVLRCWFAHPVIVDRLSALHWGQRGNYRRNALPNGPGAWQEALPKTLTWMLTEFTEKRCHGACPYFNVRKAESEQRKHDQLDLRDRRAWIRADVDRREQGDDPS